MLKKVVQVAVLAVLCIGLPALGRLEVLARTKLWILLAIAAVATIYQPAYSPADKGPEGDRGTMLQIIWSIYVTQIAAILEAIYLRYPESFAWTPWAWASLAVALLGLWFRSWAYLVLGRFFTMHVRILPEHQIVRSGPYRFCRHPSYAGAIVTYFAVPVFLGAWYTLALSALLLPFAFWRRIRVEDARLVEGLGEPYRAYMREVGALGPRLFR